MLETQLRLHAFLLGYARRLVADIDDARMADQPAPGVNHPAWILGHLAMVGDFMNLALNGTRPPRNDWSRKFGPGSKPVADRSAYPSRDELIAAHEAAHVRTESLAREADAAKLAEPHGIEFANFHVLLPTRAEFASHLLTTHEAAHLGQLAVWRRLQGKDPLF